MIKQGEFQTIVLAAGASKRFNTNKTKLIVPLCGQELILYPLKVIEKFDIPTTVIIGHDKEYIKETIAKANIKKISYIEQIQQNGTGDALLLSQPSWTREHVLVINGDMPLITEIVIQKLYEQHIRTDSAISFVTAHYPEPGGYGRVIRKNNKIQIIENRDFTDDVSTFCCINAGIYLIKKPFLEQAISELQLHENSNEFYITDLIAIASDKGERVETLQAPFDVVRGVNTLKELWACEQIKRAELMSFWMDRGVRFPMAHKVHIEIDVEIGSGTIIQSAAQLLRNSRIGKNCIIGPFSIIDNSIVHDNVIVKSHTIVENSEIKTGSSVGPFAHIHDQTLVDANAKVGNFVEMVRSTLGSESKAKHLAYLGDTYIDQASNIGAGTVTCNYNGEKKNKTIIGKGTLIGSNTSIVAPVTIGDNVITAAGSTITRDVPDEALSIARSPQINKKEYAPKLRKKYQKTQKQ